MRSGQVRSGEVRSGQVRSQVRSGFRVEVRGEWGFKEGFKNPKTWNFGVREVLAKFSKGLSKTRVLLIFQ